ncbi:MAG TPA: energy transducer TonB [Bacteroidales bacterium]|nr:energy transducer TonB [Bacteroidales bacterium]
MKRKDERVPGFDEVIFRDRNKEYGAYDLRKSYYKTLGISLLGALALAAILILLPSLTMPKKTDGKEYIIKTTVQPDGIADEALRAMREEKKIPAEAVDPKRLLAPEVVDSESELTKPMLTADEAIEISVDGVPTEIPEGVPGGESDVIPTEPLKPFISVQEMPEFPGGNTALLSFIANSLVYPQEAIENNIEGKVIVRFVVSATGSVEDVIVLASQGTGLDLSVLETEAIRVVKMLPVFEPGKQDGVAVPVYYTVPVVFQIH